MNDQPKKIRRIIFAVLFSVPLALSLVLGAQLERSDHLTPDMTGVVLAVLLSVVFAVLTALSLRWQSARKTGPDVREDADGNEGKRQADFLKLWGAIAAPNLIVLLGVYPGFFVYDAQDELMEVVTRTFTTHHPLAHVLTLGGVISAIHKVTGSWNAGIFGYLLLQILFITATEA
ncbi:MAG: hypothetical protein IK096_06205, partial [Lachnospiraceae bacterium]|nr:hypothetical protein [Lachnospiraceae bacterium]